MTTKTFKCPKCNGSGEISLHLDYAFFRGQNGVRQCDECDGEGQVKEYWDLVPAGTVEHPTLYWTNINTVQY